MHVSVWFVARALASWPLAPGLPGNSGRSIRADGPPCRAPSHRRENWNTLRAPGVDLAPQEGPMNLTRRDLAVGAMALAASNLLRSGSASADTGDEAAVALGVETMRKAWFDADRAKLEQLTAPQLSYGHSDGRVETKEQFVDAVMKRKQTVKSLEYPDLKIAVAGNAAVARHLFVAQSELDGKATTTKIGVLEVWQKQDGGWKLLARQGFPAADLGRSDAPQPA